MERRETSRATLGTLMVSTGQPVQIVDLSASEPVRIAQAAKLLHESFESRSSAWPDIGSARNEVMLSLESPKISRVAVDESGEVLGWVGAEAQYDGLVWEIHPLVVASQHRRRGIGRALVNDLENLVASRGGLTLWLGSDDELGETSLANVDLYSGLHARLAEFHSSGEHPGAFYQRLGFRVVGVLPDANGRGKPDIFFAKRIG
jgi:aminoglycoside 6'-N-acetyltransferase I